MDNLDQWINGNSTLSHPITPLQKKQFDIQKRWINEYSAPGMEFVMVPMGGLTRTPPANETSYVVVSAVLQHPFARGSVVRTFFLFSVLSLPPPCMIPSVSPTLHYPLPVICFQSLIAYPEKIVSLRKLIFNFHDTLHQTNDWRPLTPPLFYCHANESHPLALPITTPIIISDTLR